LASLNWGNLAEVWSQADDITRRAEVNYMVTGKAKETEELAAVTAGSLYTCIFLHICYYRRLDEGIFDFSE
jgi:hypothetical protein